MKCPCDRDGCTKEVYVDTDSSSPGLYITGDPRYERVGIEIDANVCVGLIRELRACIKHLTEIEEDEE